MAINNEALLGKKKEKVLPLSDISEKDIKPKEVSNSEPNSVYAEDDSDSINKEINKEISKETTQQTTPTGGPSKLLKRMQSIKKSAPKYVKPVEDKPKKVKEDKPKKPRGIFKNRKDAQADCNAVVIKEEVVVKPIVDVQCRRLLDDSDIELIGDINTNYIKWMNTLEDIDDLPPCIKYSATGFIGNSYQFLIACQESQVDVDASKPKTSVPKPENNTSQMEVNIF